MNNHVGTLYYGVDFSLAGDDDRGLPVVAVNDGYVSVMVSGIMDANDGELVCNGGWGNTVVYCESYGSGSCERAGHLREVFVKEGEYVIRGQVIGLLGGSGNSDYPHLHAQQQSSYNSSATHAWYSYKETISGNAVTNDYNGWNMVVSSATTPVAISTNEGILGIKSGQYSSQDIGNPVPPRSSGLEQNEGWQGYGWWKPYVACNDTDWNSDTTCKNEGQYRTNAYIRRFSGGNFGTAAIVYDALSGATKAYLVRSGFLSDSSNGWDVVSPQNAIDIGMPVSDEYTTQYGARQDFQWGWLRWDGSVMTRHKYGVEFNVKRSVGPGVFAPDSSVNAYRWNRQTSYRFVDTWNLHSGFNGVGEPYSDNNSGAGVHVWSGTRFLVQNFTNSTWQGPRF